MGPRANTVGVVAQTPRESKLRRNRSSFTWVGGTFTMPNPPGGGIWPGLPATTTLPSYMPASLHGGQRCMAGSSKLFILFRFMLFQVVGPYILTIFIFTCDALHPVCWRSPPQHSPGYGATHFWRVTPNIIIHFNFISTVYLYYARTPKATFVNLCTQRPTPTLAM
jgi:hypothetical protein